MDTELTVMLFRMEGGETEDGSEVETVAGGTVSQAHNRETGDIAIVEYACHPVIMQVQEQVSADFVGCLIEGVLSTLPDVRECIFLQGACADINPACGDTRQYADAERLGGELARAAAGLIGRLRAPGRAAAQPARVRAVSRFAALASRPLPGAADAETLRREAARLAIEEAEGRLTADSQERRALIAAEEALWRLHEGSRPYEAELQAIRLGDIVLLGIPGEPFCETGLEVKRNLAPLLGVPVGFANNYLGYLAPPHAWEKGGYEVRLGPWSKVGAEAYTILMTELKQLTTEII